VFFSWNAKKAAANARKHGVTFAEAETVFDDPFAGITEDTERRTTDFARAIESPPPVARGPRGDRPGHGPAHQRSAGDQTRKETL